MFFFEHVLGILLGIPGGCCVEALRVIHAAYSAQFSPCTTGNIWMATGGFRGRGNGVMAEMFRGDVKKR